LYAAAFADPDRLSRVCLTQRTVRTEILGRTSIECQSKDRDASQGYSGHPAIVSQFQEPKMHVTSEPAILYFGTPVALLSTENEDGSANLSPMSSTIFVSWRAVLGLQANSKTVENLRRTKQMVINFPSVDQVSAVNRLAKTTGTIVVPPDKITRGFRYEKSKFEIAGLTEVKSETIAPPRVLECPIQLEAVLVAERPLDEGGPLEGFLTTFEMLVQRIHVEESILMDGHTNRIDPDKWRPLIFNFQQFYGLGEKVHASTLGEIPESLYRTPDMEREKVMG
jgi:flavin reductase (DIM6/NTAB) family NADH-FMN oxidoreductase RutF